MSEISNMFNVEEDVFNYLKKYIEKHSSITTKVSRFVIKNENPLIVFEEERNDLSSRSTTYDYTTRALSYRIDIYCKKLPQCKKIVKELIVLVCEVMEEIYRMKGGVTAYSDNYDGVNIDSSNAILRFTTNFIPEYNKIY